MSLFFAIIGAKKFGVSIRFTCTCMNCGAIVEFRLLQMDKVRLVEGKMSLKPLLDRLKLL